MDDLVLLTDNSNMSLILYRSVFPKKDRTHRVLLLNVKRLQVSFCLKERPPSHCTPCVIVFCLGTWNGESIFAANQIQKARAICMTLLDLLQRYLRPLSRPKGPCVLTTTHIWIPPTVRNPKECLCIRIHLEFSLPIYFFNFLIRNKIMSNATFRNRRFRVNQLLKTPKAIRNTRKLKRQFGKRRLIRPNHIRFSNTVNSSDNNLNYNSLSNNNINYMNALVESRTSIPKTLRYGNVALSPSQAKLLANISRKYNRSQNMISALYRNNISNKNRETLRRKIHFTYNE